MSETDYARLADEACERLKVKQSWLRQQTEGLDHFDWNQGSRLLVFSTPGMSPMIAEIDFVGDVSMKSNTWLWAWDNPSVDESLKTASRRVKKFGETRRIPRLYKATWDATEVDGWEMTAISAEVLGAEAAYRTKDGDGFTFMTLRNLRPAPPGFVIDHSGDGE